MGDEHGIGLFGVRSTHLATGGTNPLNPCHDRANQRTAWRVMADWRPRSSWIVMAKARDKRRQGRRHGAVVGALALAALLVFPGAALAGQDELKGGSVVLQLQNSRGLKLKPKNLTLPINGGAVDPVDGSGTAQVGGGFNVKRGKGKAKVKIATLNLVPGGGSITAQVNGDFV